MAGIVTANVRAVINSSLDPNNSYPAIATPRDNVDLGITVNFSGSGGGASAAQNHYRARITVPAASTATLDLSSATTNPFGTALAFTTIKALMAYNTGLANVVMDPHSSTGWAAAFADDIVIPPSGVVLMACPGATGWAVVAGVTDTIRFANASGADCLVDFIVIGN